jgi:hypothetical protein
MRRLYTVALMLGLVAAPTAAFAHPDNAAATPEIAAKRAAKREARLDALFAKLDVNKDGSISRAELAGLKKIKARMMKSKLGHRGPHRGQHRGQARRLGRAMRGGFGGR